MASILRAATANEWWDSLNTVRTKLGLSSATDRFTTDKIAMSEDLNTYINNMNGLKSNTYGQYASWTTISTVADNNIIKEDVGTRISSMLTVLNKLCPNTVTAEGGMSTSFAVEGTTVSTNFSVTSFSQTLDCSRNGRNTNFSDASDCSRCGRRSGTSNFSNTGCSFSTSNSYTGNRTESSFQGRSNTSNQNRTNQTNNSQSANSNFSDFGTNGTTNTNNSRASETNNTRFSQSQAAGCNNTATSNSVTANSNVFTGFAVRG